MMDGWRTTVKGDSYEKFTDAIRCTGESELISKQSVIDHLAIVKFKWTAKKLNDKLKIYFYFSSSKHESAKNRTVKINIASTYLKYVKQDFDTSDNWSEWQLMGSIEPSSNEGIYLTLCDFYVSAFEVKLDKLRLRLHTDTDFTDFHLATTEGTVAVHKSCLAAQSEVFKTMLTGEWKETAEGKINIKGVSVQTLQHLKDYIYLSTVPDEGLCPLLLLAQCYLIEDLEKHCIRKLAETVLPKDLYTLIEFACENNIPKLAYAMLQITKDSVINEANAINKQPDLKKEQLPTTDRT